MRIPSSVHIQRADGRWENICLEMIAVAQGKELIDTNSYALFSEEYLGELTLSSLFEWRYEGELGETEVEHIIDLIQRHNGSTDCRP